MKTNKEREGEIGRGILKERKNENKEREREIGNKKEKKNE